MTTPTTTVFEVKITNKLKDKPIFVQLQAELQYATHVTASSVQQNKSKKYQQTAVERQRNGKDYTKTARQQQNRGKDFKKTARAQQDKEKNYSKTANSFALEESKTDKTDYSHSDYNDDLSHKKSANSKASAQSSTTKVDVDGSYGLASVKVSVGHDQSSSNSSSSAKDNLQKNVASKQRSGLDEHASTDKRRNSALNVASNQFNQSNSSLNVNSNEFDRSNSALNVKSKEFGQSNAAKNIWSNEFDKSKVESSSASILNTIIEPGFARIAPLQSMSIPVIVAYESQVVYLTVYTMTESGKKLFISNGLQLNRQNVEIVENVQSGFIEIKLSTNIKSKFNLFRSFLSKWGIPDFLQDAMQSAGWHDMSLWNKLGEEHLVSMGFKSGHRVLLLSKYKQYLRKKNKIKTDIDCTHLLQSWNLPNFLHENMIKKGWDDIELWDIISDKQLRDMAFEDGHIVKFRKHVNKSGDHLKEFDALKKSLRSNKIFIDSMSDEESEENEEIAAKIPNAPRFKVDADKILFHSFEFELLGMRKNERYIVEIKEKNGRWEPVRHFKKVKIGRIDNLKANTEYFVRIMAENEYLSKSKYSKEIQMRTMQYPICGQLVKSKNYIRIDLEKDSLNELSQCSHEKNAMLQINLSNSENDEKSEWMNVSAIKRDKENEGEIVLKYYHKLKDFQVRSWKFYNVRLKIECEGYTELGEAYTFSEKDVQKPKEIEIEYHSHRGHWSKHHPNMLFSSDSDYYSEGNEKFKKNESDWLVFKMRKAVILTNVAIQHTLCAVTPGGLHPANAKKIKVFVGDGENKWNVLKSNGNEIIQTKQVKELQWFNLEELDTCFKYIRLEIPDPGPNPRGCYSTMRYLKFKGI